MESVAVVEEVNPCLQFKRFVSCNLKDKANCRFTIQKPIKQEEVQIQASVLPTGTVPGETTIKIRF